MTRIALELKHRDTLSCTDSVIVCVGDYFNEDTSPCFINCFDFYYAKNDGMLNLGNKKTWPHDSGNFENHKILLRDYCGIQYDAYEATMLSDIDETIAEQISDLNPVSVMLDSFYLPWNKHYLQYGREHTVLILGVDENAYICMDPFYNNPYCVVEKEIIIKHSKVLQTYKKTTSHKKPSLSETIDKIKNYQRINCQRMNYMDDFAHDLSNMKFTKEDRDEYSSFDQAPLLFCLTNLCWSRINYLGALQYVASTYKTSRFDEAISCFPQTIKLWKKMKQLFMMSFHSCKEEKYLGKAGAVVREIKAKEGNIIDMIISL